MRFRQPSARRRRRGAVAVVITLGLIPLIGVMAFAFDGGLLLASKRRTQTVADTAAHAAACQLYANITTDPTALDLSGKAHAAALLNASSNGFSNDGTTNSVTINIPPQSGYFVGKPGYAEVLITYTQARIFAAVVGSGSFKIGARGVCRGLAGGPTPYSTASLILLDPNAAGALTVTGGGNITTQSTIQVDSSNATAGNANNAGFVTAPSIQITGNYTTSGSGKFTTTVDSAVKTAAPSMADPLASLAAPTTTGLTAQSFQSTYGRATISPGIYTGGLSLANGMQITMSPGVYYMKSGSFSVAGGVTLNGSGVTIYEDSGGGALNIQGGAIVNLTPPTTGTYAGLTYFQDRSSATALNIANGALIDVSGTIYAPDAAISIAGGTLNKYGSQVIGKTLNVSNGAIVRLTTVDDEKLGYVASGTSTSSVTIVE